jgi:hypothetical protein
MSPEFVLFTTDTLNSFAKTPDKHLPPGTRPHAVSASGRPRIAIIRNFRFAGSGVIQVPPGRFPKVRTNGCGNSPLSCAETEEQFRAELERQIAESPETSARRERNPLDDDKDGSRRWWPAPAMKSKKPKPTSLKLTLADIVVQRRQGRKAWNSRKVGATGHPRRALKLTSLHQHAAGNPNVKFGLLRRLLRLQLSNLCRRQVVSACARRVRGSMNPVYNCRLQLVWLRGQKMGEK